MTSEEREQKFHADDVSLTKNLGGASDWSYREEILLQPIRSTTQIWVVTRHQYGNAGFFLRLLYYDHVIYPG